MTTGVINTGAGPRLLELGANTIFGQAYDSHEVQWDKFYTTHTSSRNFELDIQWEGLGLAPVKDEGDGIAYDSQAQGFIPKYPHLVYGKGIIASEEMIEDNQYGLFASKNKTMAFSMQQTKETVGANVINRGFNSAFLMTGGDGVELFSTVHSNGPSGGTFSNELAVAAPLTEKSLEDMLIQINQATDPRGLNIAIKGMQLITHPSEGPEAVRILQSVLQPGNMNNDINATRAMGLLSKGSTVNNYLSSATAWFVVTDAPHGLKYYTRRPVRFQQDNDFGTSNMRFKATERYSFGWTDPRGAYGTPGV